AWRSCARGAAPSTRTPAPTAPSSSPSPSKSSSSSRRSSSRTTPSCSSFWWATSSRIREHLAQFRSTAEAAGCGDGRGSEIVRPSCDPSPSQTRRRGSRFGAGGGPARRCGDRALGRVVARAAGVALELPHDVGAEELDLAARGAPELPQPRLIVEARAAVLFHHGLVQDEPGRAAWVLQIHFGVVEISVSGVEQPACVGSDGDACVAEGVAPQGDEEDLRGQAFEVSDAAKAVPAFAVARVVHAPVRLR